MSFFKKFLTPVTASVNTRNSFPKQEEKTDVRPTEPTVASCYEPTFNTFSHEPDDMAAVHTVVRTDAADETANAVHDSASDPIMQVFGTETPVFFKDEEADTTDTTDTTSIPDSTDNAATAEADEMEDYFFHTLHDEFTKAYKSGNPTATVSPFFPARPNLAAAEDVDDVPFDPISDDEPAKTAESGNEFVFARETAEKPATEPLAEAFTEPKAMSPAEPFTEPEAVSPAEAFTKPEACTESGDNSVESEPQEKSDKQTFEVRTAAVPLTVHEEQPVSDCFPTPRPVSTPGSVTVASFFDDRGVLIESENSKEVVAPVESLAFNIAINYQLSRNFIRFLRETITKKQFTFKYYLNSLSQAERNACLALADTLYEHGLMPYREKSGNIIKGTLSSAPRFINFINGDFLELYAKCVAIGVVRKMAEKYGCDYEFYHNMVISKGSQQHELDIVFRVGEHVFWGEIKSGNFNPDEYRKLGLFLGVVPDRLIILAANKSNDVAASISYFNECFCANISTFKSSLYRMIDNAFGKEEN